MYRINHHKARRRKTTPVPASGDLAKPFSHLVIKHPADRAGCPSLPESSRVSAVRHLFFCAVKSLIWPEGPARSARHYSSGGEWRGSLRRGYEYRKNCALLRPLFARADITTTQQWYCGRMINSAHPSRCAAPRVATVITSRLSIASGSATSAAVVTAATDSNVLLVMSRNQGILN